MPQPPQPPQDEPQPHSQHTSVDVPDNEEGINSGQDCYIEEFSEEYLAGATWGCCKLLFEYLDEEQKREGISHWSLFRDEDEWELAELLIQNVGQRQTDAFLKLPIVRVSLYMSLSMY